jgi:conjugal transfer pilus assembly protein TraW
MANILGLWFLLSLVATPILAEDLGVHGHTFAIGEQDLLGLIQNRLLALTPTHLAALQDRVQQHYQKMIEEPPPVDGLSKARVGRIIHFDPTIALSQDITDHEGNIILKKGTSVNPLTISPLGGDLLFFDGTDLSHLEWANEQPQSARWILVKGRPMDLGSEKDRAVYFDQFGFLVRKFGIEHIPARVSQEGAKLRIEEIPLEV